MASYVQKVASLGPKVVNLAKATQTAAVPRLQTFWHYAQVELRPPSPSELPQIQKGFADLVSAARTQKWRTLTVKEAGLNALVAIEVACWFFVGEVIGKGHLVGYQVPGAVDFEAHI
jgi:F-type H+-transporting ATPase subunit g